jgi:hypothetical protein
MSVLVHCVVSVAFLVVAVAAAPILWSGALTDSSVRVVARSEVPATDELLVWNVDGGSPENARRFAATRVIDDWKIVQFAPSQLLPSTAYAYALASNVGNVGRFRTLHPLGSAANFTFALSACADSGADHPVFSHLAASEALFYVNAGDLYYGDIPDNDTARFRAEFDLLFEQPTQRQVFAAFPLVYVPDDHDFGPNNADGSSKSKPAVHRVYREVQPHYPLSQRSADEPLFAHAFTVGRARFIVSDLRSDKSPPTAVPRVIMSEWQVEWFKAELLNASRDAAIDVVFWVEGVPLIDDDDVPAESDTWACCPAMRSELARFIHSLEALRGRIFALSGDAHSIMVDDGTHNQFHKPAGGPLNDTADKGFPVIHSAALSRPPSKKGGPYSHGCSVQYNQFGLISVSDAGVDADDPLRRRRVCVEFTGIEWASGSADEEDDDDAMFVASNASLDGYLRARVRYNSCNETRSIFGDQECRSSTLTQKLAPFKTEAIVAIALCVAALLAIVACVVVWKFKLLDRLRGKQPATH